MTRGRFPGEGDRWLELASELVGRLGGVLRDVVPAEAQHHLLNAQRELLTALILTYEFQAGARRRRPPGKRAGPAARRRSRPAAARITKIDIE